MVLSWRDARNDAANARVATYITTSIDGGQTFGPQTYANPPETAVDAITGQTNIIGPASDDESSGNAQRDATFGYGNQMGLAVADGQIFPIWAGNFYGPFSAAENFLDSFFNTSTNAVNALPAEHLVPADDHRGRAADHLQHDGARAGATLAKPTTIRRHL